MRIGFSCAEAGRACAATNASATAAIAAPIKLRLMTTSRNGGASPIAKEARSLAARSPFRRYAHRRPVSIPRAATDCARTGRHLAMAPRTLRQGEEAAVGRLLGAHLNFSESAKPR